MLEKMYRTLHFQQMKLGRKQCANFNSNVLTEDYVIRINLVN